MDKNSSEVLLLGEGSAVRYTVLTPNFETGELVRSEIFKEANRLTFFCFPFDFSHKEEGDGIEYDNSNEQKYCSNISKKAFRIFIEKLQEKASEAGAHYVLIQMKRNSKAASYNWLIEAKCQFLLNLS